MTHTEFYNDAVDRTLLPEKTHEDIVEIMLGVIAESLAAIADSLENMEDSLENMKDSIESISDNMWTDGSNL